MVQILPKIPGFGEQLGQTLGSVAESLGQGFIQRRNNQLDNQILSSLESEYQSGNVSPLNMIKKFSSISPEKQAALTPIIGQFIANQTQSQGLANQELARKEEVGGTLNDIADELGKGHSGLFNYYNKFSGKGRESRAYIDTKSLSLEKRLAEMVGKGALSKSRFDYLVSKLPSSNDSDATNRGKLRALAEEFKVEIKNPKFKEAFKEESNNPVSQVKERPSLGSFYR